MSNNNAWKKICSCVLAVCLIGALLVSNQSFGVLAEEENDVATSTSEETSELVNETIPENDEDIENAKDELEDLTFNTDSENEDEMQSVSVEADDTVTMDLYYGDIAFSDDSVTYYENENKQTSISYDPSKSYRITQTDANNTTNHTISVGTENAAVTKAYTIYLAGVNIDAPKETDNHKAAIYVNTSNNTVNLVLENNSKNTVVAYAYGTDNTDLKTHFTHSAIEKEIDTKGTLRITCEEGVNAKGHDCTNTGKCGSLTATAKSNNRVYWNGAGIGSKGYIGYNYDHSGTESTSGTLYNLVIAGGVISATGASGNGNGGGPGIGVAQSGPNSLAVGYNAKGLEIDGGYIIAKAGNGATTNIGGGFHSGYIEMTINGGYIEALRGGWDIGSWFQADVGAAIGGGSGGSSTSAFYGTKVTINGGTIKASAAYGAAIGSSAGGSNGDGAPATVIINGGTIDASTTKGYGAAIGTGGSAAQEATSANVGKASDANIEINGGTINASSQYGADIGGGGTQSKWQSAVGGNATISITDGTIITTGNGLGGGLASAGQGGNARIKISGGMITTTAIGGGDSDSNKAGDASVNISAGILDVKGKIGGGYSKTGTPGAVTGENQSAGIIITGGTLKAGTIGGGTNDNGEIGFATVDISGGTIQGQFILSNSDATKQCKFTMTGGTIDNSSLGAAGADEEYTMAQPNGGAVYLTDANGEVFISGGNIKSAKATLGGAIYMTEGSFELSGTGAIYDCKAEKGGAVYLEKGTVAVSGGTIGTVIDGVTYPNTADEGAGIYMAGGSLNVTGGQISNNMATEDGGGAYLQQGTLTLTSGSVTGNKAKNGAGSYLAGGNLQINGGSVSGNTASENGGGFYLAGGNLRITDGTLSKNTAQNGGGVYVADSIVRMFGGTFSENTAAENGGGMYVSSDEKAADVVIRSGRLYKNRTENTDGTSNQGNGGAIAVISDNSENADHIIIGLRETHPQLDVDTRKFDSFTYTEEKDDNTQHEHSECPEITENQAYGNGGGIYMSSNVAILDIYCLREDKNEAEADSTGGGIMAVGGQVNIGDVGDDGTGNNTPTAKGNIFIKSPMLVKGGTVKIYGNTDNPQFDEKILVDIRENAGSFHDYRYTKITGGTNYKIEYFENFNKSGIYTAIQYDADKDITAMGTMYIHKGYKIIGWNTRDDGKGTMYTTGKLIGSQNDHTAWEGLGDTEALKLYAIWEKISYTVEYYPNASAYTGTMTSDTYVYGEQKELAENGFKVVGKRFVNWNTEEDGTGTTYEASYNESAMSDIDGSTVKLYAQWADCTHAAGTAHPGTLSYTVNAKKDTITESCDCGGYTATVRISGADAYHDGATHPAALSYKGTLGEQEALLAGDIEITYNYKQDINGTYGEIPAGTQEPVEIGYYKASITIGGKTAFAEYQIKSPAEAATIDVAVKQGEQFADFNAGKTCNVAQDDAFTVQYTVQKLNYGSNDESGKPYSAVPALTLSQALPNGTSIIMQIGNDYWYNNSPATTEISLTSFIKMGTQDEYFTYYSEADIKDEQRYRFIIDFSNAENNINGELKVGLKYAYKDERESENDKEEQAVVTVGQKPEFKVTVSEEKNVCTVTAPPSVADTRWNRKNLVWKIAATDTAKKLPSDAKLTVSTTANEEEKTATYSLNAKGAYIIPFTWTDSQSFMFTLSSQQEAIAGQDYTLTAVLCIGSEIDGTSQPAALEDNLQKASDAISLKVPVVTGPALRISGQDRVLSRTESLKVRIEYENVDGNKIRAIIQKKTTGQNYDGNYYDSGDSITTAGDYTFPLQAVEEPGSYRLWVTVSTQSGQTLLEVPYYFIVQ